MNESQPLPPDFYDRPPDEAARALLGCRLFSRLDGGLTGGIITETEAYGGMEDQASHARRGPTARSQIMFGPPGRAYVYRIYGLHWCLNAVTGPGENASAVLIRALVPDTGLELIADRRAGVPEARWTDGPAKLCRALAVTGAQNGRPLSDPGTGLWIAQGKVIADERVERGPRVGVDYAPEPWRSLPWRFRLEAAALEDL